MATTISTSNSSGPSKQSIFTSGHDRRPSTSSLTGYSPNYSQGIGHSPSTPASPASSGIPTFRSLRSLLPFGSNKNTTTTTTSVSTSSPNTRSSFDAFRSVRRSMTKDREREVSVSNDTPVIAIENPFPDETAVSLSKLEKPLPSETTIKDPSTSFGDNLLPSSFTLRTPSLGPALSAELSTIIEAENSGVSKHIAANPSPTTTTNRKTISMQEHNTHTHSHKCDIDGSAMDMAIREGESLKDQWLNADKEATIIDGDGHPDMADTTFNMESVDRDLPELPSPHSISKQVPSSALTSSPAPSPNIPAASPASRLPRARPISSCLPRLRSPNLPSISQTPLRHTHTPPPSKPSPSIENGYNALVLAPSPLGVGNLGSHNRSTSLRSALEYNPVYGGREDRERDREREIEIEMMREMKEKHGTETGALLEALSDSQHTARVLREENSDLRGRLERFAVAIQINQELRRVCEGLQSECGSLRKENSDMRKELVEMKGLVTRGGGGNSSGVRTPIPKTAMNNSGSSPLRRTFTPRVAFEEEYGNSEVETHITEHGSSSPYINVLASPSSKKRRLSDSSSIFPIPASNMSLLLHEDVTSTLGSIASCSSSSIGTEHSQYGFSLPPPPIRAAAPSSSSSSSASSQRIETHVRSISHSPTVSYHDFAGNIPPNSSVISVDSISPSMATGSPGSLFLRPEHESLLCDMESLDLGVRGDDDDGW